MLQTPYSNRIFYAFAALSSIALMVYAVYRAIHIPVTHDEAITWFYANERSVPDVIGYVETYGMPNNHILNSLLLKATTALFGSTPFALRLPNLVFFGIYLYAAVRVSMIARSRLVSLATFALLCFNPYLFDFFHLARGYGMANALLLLAVWRLYLWSRDRSTFNAGVVFLTITLMVLSNFTTLHVFMAFIVVYVGVLLYRDRPFTFRKIIHALKVPLIASLLLGVVLYEPFRCILKWKTTYGGTTGFWTDCVQTTIYASFPDAPYSSFLHDYLPGILIFALVLTAAFAGYKVIRKQPGLLLPALALLWIPILLLELQHFLLGTEFPVPRAIQFIYPLFVLSVCAAMNEWQSARTWARVSFGLAGVCMIMHLLITAQTDYVTEWKYDGDNRIVLNDVEAIATQEKISRPIRLSISWVFEPGLNYEIDYRNDGRFMPVTRDSCTTPGSDFYYVIYEDTDLLTRRGFKLVQRYPHGGSLFRADSLSAGN